MAQLTSERHYLLKAIKATKRQWSLARLSEALGRNPAYLHQYLYRQSPRLLSEDDRHKLGRILSISQAKLRPASAPDLADTSDDIAQIPLLDIETAAGAASIIDDTAETGFQSWPFQTAILRTLPHSHISHLRLITVRGDSMSPVLEDGDIIMIDTGQTDPHKEGIFVLDDGHGLVVKRLSLIHDKSSKDPPRLRISSANPAYVPYRRALEDVRILGHVIWMARTMAKA
ncbi:MAG: S24 family peptidase [Candidatus Puniceispirillaceae bacterium]